MNIQYDFSNHSGFSEILKQQPLAIMPADLAKKLLKMYADNLNPSEGRRIIRDHIEDLMKCVNQNDLDAAIGVSLAWIAKRELIGNISQGNWDAYEVKKKEETLTQQMDKITIAAVRTEKPHNEVFTDGRDLDRRD